MFLFFPGLPVCLEKNHRSSLPWTSGSNIITYTEWKLVMLYSSWNTKWMDKTGKVALDNFMGISTVDITE